MNSYVKILDVVFQRHGHVTVRLIATMDRMKKTAVRDINEAGIMRSRSHTIYFNIHHSKKPEDICYESSLLYTLRFIPRGSISLC